MRPGARCWLWMGARINGYGRLKINKQSKWAHRASYEHYVGAIPNGQLVLHHCDTPACINPEHLFLGTQKDNIADCCRKGRRGRSGASLVGEANPARKLTAADVLAMRASHESQTALAARYGVSQARVSKILRREAWKHL